MSRRTKAQWRELILQQQSSGLSAAEFCRRESVNPKYFSVRKKQLSDVSSSFVEVTPVSASMVAQQLSMNPFDENLYVFCNRGRDKLKILHWDKTYFVMWYKRLENDRFKWPIDEFDEVIELTEQSLHWLLSDPPATIA